MDWLAQHQGLIQWLTTLILTLAVFSSRAGRIHGDFQRMVERIDKAGREISTLTSKIQGLPEELRKMFVPKELAEEWNRESREDRRDLRNDITELQRTIYRDPFSRTRATDK